MTAPVLTFVIFVENGWYSKVTLTHWVDLFDLLMGSVVFVDRFPAAPIRHFRQLVRFAVFELPTQAASAGCVTLFKFPPSYVYLTTCFIGSSALSTSLRSCMPA